MIPIEAVGKGCEPKLERILITRGVGGEGELFLTRLDDEAITGFAETCSKGIDDKLQRSPAGSGPLFLEPFGRRE